MKRLVPEMPFPPYTFVPGLAPHPYSAPSGHSFGKEEPAPESPDPLRWWECKTYLYGIDLFNGPVPLPPSDRLPPEERDGYSGAYWESHVEFESLWLACGRRGPAADYFKAWVQLAAAGVKHREGVPAGVASHAARAAELWRGVLEATGGPSFFGFDLAELARLADEIRAAGWPTPPPVLLPRMPA